MLGKERYNSSRSKSMSLTTERIGKELNARSADGRATRIVQRSSEGRAITAVETNWRLINARLPLTIVSRARQEGGSQRRASCNSFAYRTSILRVKELNHRRKRDFRYVGPITFTRSFVSLSISRASRLWNWREERKYVLLSTIGPLLTLYIIPWDTKFDR